MTVRARLTAELLRRGTLPAWELAQVEVPPQVAEALHEEGLPLPALLEGVRVEVARGDPGGTHYLYRCRRHAAENCATCLRPTVLKP